MTPDHDHYFRPAEQQRDFFAITEHVLCPMVFHTDRHLLDSMRFFRVPSEAAGYSSLAAVAVKDIREGDTVLLIDVCDQRLRMMRLMYVTQIECGECFYVVVNDFLDHGQGLIDRFAGLLGRIPTE